MIVNSFSQNMQKIRWSGCLESDGLINTCNHERTSGLAEASVAFPFALTSQSDSPRNVIEAQNQKRETRNGEETEA